MSTNATITYNEKSIYMHWDGYPEYALDMLRKFYNTPEKAAELIAMGGMSELNETIEESVFYHRDRGEDFYNAKQTEEFNYIYIKESGGWSEMIPQQEREQFS